MLMNRISPKLSHNVNMNGTYISARYMGDNVIKVIHYDMFKPLGAVVKTIPLQVTY